MNKMNVLPLFASNLVFSTIDDKFNTIKKDTIDFYKGSDKDQTSKVSESLYVLNNYKELGYEILNLFNQYAGEILSLDNKFSFSTSWFTKMEPGNFCNFHYHSNSFYSGLFYFDEYNDNSGDICFLNPLNQINNFTINSRVSNTNHAKEYILTPQKNMLLFFPSYIWHKILTNSSNTTRYSLAFNLIPVGQYGSGDSTYNTEWFKS